MPQLSQEINDLIVCCLAQDKDALLLGESLQGLRSQQTDTYIDEPFDSS